MAYLVGQDSYDNVYQWEETDPLLGGEGNQMNWQAQQLLNRTVWLANRSGIQYRHKALLEVTSNYTLQSADAGKVIVLKAIGNHVVLTLDALANYPTNALFVIKTMAVTGKSCTIQTSNSESIWYGTMQKSKVYLHDAEYVVIAAGATAFEIVNDCPALKEVGQPIDGYVQMPNTLIRDGRVINRADYPRLTEWLLNNNNPESGIGIVGETTWLTSGNLYRGCFTLGDLTTTIRLPDDRAMFTRYADLGRGLDVGRFNKVGSYQDDAIKSHSVDIPVNKTSQGATGHGKVTTGNEAIEDAGVTAAAVYTGENETRPKNTSKLPLIKI